MEYYAKILGGEITKMQTFADAPIDAPDGSASWLFDAELIAQQLTIKGSDSFPGQEVSVGKNISLFLSFSDRTQQSEVYSGLLEGGEVVFELNEQSGFAMLTDKFGISWMLAYHPE
jgi:PhnB protein